MFRLFSKFRQLKRAQESFKQLEDNYNLLTDNLAASIVMRDKQGGITFCSPFTEVLTGYSMKEICDSSKDFFLSIVHSDDKERYIRAQKIADAGEPFQYRYRFFHRTGLEMWAETRTVPISNENSNASSLSVTFDITASVRREQQINQINKDLQEFTYMVSHDLKAPIFTIKGVLSLLKEDSTLSKESLENLGHIQRATIRLEQLVKGVIEYAKISNSEAQLGQVDSKALAKEIERDFSTQIQACECEVIISESLPLVCADKMKLYQILSNLISNSIKYRSHERKPRIELTGSSSTNSNYAQIVVSDNGRGMNPEQLKHLFKPFQRNIDDSIEGSGVGLACVKKLVEKLGADIEVTSTPAKGTTFTLKIRRWHNSCNN